VIEKLSYRAFCKIAAPVSPRRGYPELPDLSDNPLPKYTIVITRTDPQIVHRSLRRMLGMAIYRHGGKGKYFSQGIYVRRLVWVLNEGGAILGGSK